ncbi:MAG: metallophosphoesterase [Anaerolineales bacterium]|nr:metallophosphoesterase [Anaerolineales bacterium]
MRIAVMSDSHDNIWKLAQAIPHMAEADVILHCGDLISPFMIVRLVQGVKDKPIHIVWGNNDGDKRLLSEMAANAGNVKLHGEYALLELEGLKVAINHYPKVARALAESGKYDLVCYGHDHTAHEEWIGDTLLLNPGELMGMQGRSTIAMYDSERKTVEFVEV